ncbi:hypothetical protein [Rariglobus hedericola]|uniref:Uncharacterized protein n=1 Tax=Rariglobus hedericola TaxID=2597822 RepID=A0A556QN38_9BACT|nr:hypothetical protein [Rariglobus hedericola]TSJ78049.1 hypothetical protein FPL22_01690 [Rariglobus hedericola]
MPSRQPEVPRRAIHWLLPAALLALAPKCMLCVLAYAGAGAVLGLSGPEICGASTPVPIAYATLLAWLGATAGLAAFILLASRRDQRAAPTPADDHFGISGSTR